MKRILFAVKILQLTSALLKVSAYLHYIDRLRRDMSFNWLTDRRKGLSQWHRGRGRGGGTLASLFLFLLPVRSVQVTGQLEKCNVLKSVLQTHHSISINLEIWDIQGGKDIYLRVYFFSWWSRGILEKVYIWFKSGREHISVICQIIQKPLNENVRSC